ncbi:MAG: hypothetical protein ACETWK_07545 [Candidatus Aminicenantaceae bacterium]
MDAYLSQEAYQFLISLKLVSPKPNLDGLLIGHKRGHRIIVEKILPTQKGFYSSFKNYVALDEHFDGKLVGFFTFDSNEKKLNKILLPFALGQLFLDIHLKEKKKMDIKSYIIDFEKDFFLSSVNLKLPQS